MSVNLSLLGGAGWQFFTDNGTPLAGGLLYTYLAGTSTAATTYTTSAGNVPNSNPIVLNSAGRVQTEIWLTQGVSYKFVLKTSAFITIGTYDNIDGAADPAPFYAFEAALAASSGSSLVGFIQSGSGAVATTVQTKLRETVSAADFGVVGDGSADDTDNLRAAITAATGKTLYVYGTPLISDTITFAYPIRVVFDGPSRSIDSYQNSYLIKKNGVNFPGIVITAADFIGEGGGVQKEVGGTAPGYGVQILGVNCNWYNLSVFDMGSDGIRIGNDTGSANVNGFCLIRPTATSNGGHGIHIGCNAGALNANAGTITTPQCQGNSLDGMFLENTSLNSIIGPLLEQNKRWGLNFASTATQNTVVGGDVEANNQGLLGAKDIWIQATAGAGNWGQTIINTVVSAGGGGPYLVNDDSYSTILGTQSDYLASPNIQVPAVRTASILNTGSSGPPAKAGTAWGGIIAGATTNASGFVAVNASSSVTLFPMDATTGQAVLVYITQGADSYCTVALVAVPEGGAAAIVTELYKTNANLTVTASGLNVQATNATLVLKTVTYSVIRFA